MAVSDFLFNGSPPPSTTNYGSTTANVPAWYNDFVQGIAAKGNAIAAEPYQVYGQPRIAGFNQTQNDAFSAVRNNVGAFTPTMQSGIGTVQNAASGSALGAAQPMLGQAASMNPSGAASGFLSSAAGIDPRQSSSPLYGAAISNSAAAAGSGALGRAEGLSPTGAANPFLQNAASMNPVGQAQPFANAASGTFTGSNVSQYMNPFIENVINRQSNLAARALNEKLIPAIGDDFIRAGQYGSTRMMGEVGKALRDTSEGLTDSIGSTLAQGYGQAGQLFGQDQSRLAGLAGTMGNLGVAAQNAGTNLAQTAGSLANQEMSTLGNLAQTRGNLTTADNTNLMNAGTQLGQQAGQYGSLLANVGQTTGNLQQGQMNALANIGQVTGNLANADATTDISAGRALSDMATAGQSMNLRDTASLLSVGDAQRALDQQNLDVAYSDFQSQRDYPMTQLGALSNLVRGYQVPTSTTRVDTAQPSAASASSGLATLTGGLSTLLSAFKAKGGRIDAAGHRRGALNRLRHAHG